MRVLDPIGDYARRVSNGIEKFLRHYNQICDSGIYPSLDWASSSDGLSNRCYKPPHGDAGATSKNRNVGSNKVFVIGASRCLGLRGQHPPRMGEAGATRLDTVTQVCGSNIQLCSQGIPMPGNARPTPLQHPQTGVRITIKAMNKRLMTRVLTPSSF